MKRVRRKATDELRREYKRSDFGELVRGKYADRLKASSNVVLLRPEVARAFPNDEAINEALSSLLKVARRAMHVESLRPVPDASLATSNYDDGRLPFLKPSPCDFVSEGIGP